VGCPPNESAATLPLLLEPQSSGSLSPKEKASSSCKLPEAFKVEDKGSTRPYLIVNHLNLVASGNGDPNDTPNGARPGHLIPSHWAELVAGSGIRPDVAAANFASFGPETGLAWQGERDEMVDIERHRIQTSSTSSKGDPQGQPGHLFSRLIKLDQRYRHLEGGGWRFLGAAFPGGRAPTPRWKPSQPRLDGKGKAIKYEAQPGKRPGLLLPQVPDELAAEIAQQNHLAAPTGPMFWQWLRDHPCVPLTVVEGEKKACSVIGLGVVAIGLAGVEMGRTVERNAAGERIEEALIPELQALAEGGRQVTICFDTDSKRSTRRKVLKAAIRLGHCLKRAGAKVRVAALPLLQGQKTGADDYLVKAGAEALLRVLAAASPLGALAWKQRNEADRKALSISAFDADMAQPDAPIIAVRAPKGSGKTAALGRWIADDSHVLSITHRQALGSALAQRLGLVWRNAADSATGKHWDSEGNRWEGLPGRYSLCIDSLLAIPPAAFAGGTVVIDEAEQVVTHLLTSDTCKKTRAQLIGRLHQIIAHARKLIILDADLSDAVVNFLTGDHPAALLSSDDKAPSSCPVAWYSQTRPEAIEAALIKQAKEGPVFITTDSRERAAALHDLLQHHLPEAKGLLITSDTTHKAETQAWVGKLTSHEVLKEGGIRWVVASPSISSGLSIEHGYFRSVFGFFGAGTFDDAEAAQALARIRPNVSRHTWVAPHVRPAVAPLTSAWWPKQVERDLTDRWSSQSARLLKELQGDLAQAVLAGGDEKEKACDQLRRTVALWSHLQSRRNYSLAHLREFIRARLEHEGHRIVEAAEDLPKEEGQTLKRTKKAQRTKRVERHTKAVAEAAPITQTEAARLQRQNPSHPALQAQYLRQRLALSNDHQLTPDEVAWGSEWAGSAERLMHLQHPDQALKRDVARLRKTTAGESPLLTFDQSYRWQEAKAAEVIGLGQFIETVVLTGKEWGSDDPSICELAGKARQHAHQLEMVLGLKVRINDSNTALVAALLRHYGITTTRSRKVRGRRSYTAEPGQLGKLTECSERLRCRASGEGAPKVNGVYNQHTPGAPNNPETGDASASKVTERWGIGLISCSEQERTLGALAET